MKKPLTYLTFTIPLVNLAIFLQFLLIFVTGGLVILRSLGQAGQWIERLLTFIEANGGQVTLAESGVEVNILEFLTTVPIWVFILGFIDALLLLGVLLCIRRFLKNIQADDIFVASNVRLAKTAAILILVNSFLDVGTIPTEGISLNVINLTYLITALLVWTISKVLEQANAIAEENDFTI